MAIDFPASPTLNDVFTVGNVTYVWDGTKWTASVTGGISLDKIEEGNTSAEVIDTGSDGRFVVTTEGTEALRVDSSGRLGVGTTTPQSPLTVGATTDFGAIVKISRTDANFNSGMLVLGNGNSTSNYVGVWRGDANSVTTGGQYLNLGGYDGIVFAAGASALGAQTERMRIDSSGRVGIGTTNPSFRLHSYDTTAAQGFFNGWSSGGTFDAAGAIRFGNQTGYQGRIDFDPSGNTNFIFENSYLNGAISWKINGTERLRIDPAGNVGIGTTSPTTPLSVRAVSNIPTYGNVSANFSDNTTGTLYISHSSGVQGLISDGTLAFGSGASGTERARIDSSGRLLVGTSTARTLLSQSMGIQIETTDYPACGLSIVNNQNADANPLLLIGKSRGATLNSNTIVQSGDTLGEIHFLGADGSAMLRAASIRCLVDGTPGANDMPSRLVFSTTANGASSPTERMRITQDGYWKVSNTGSYAASIGYHEMWQSQNEQGFITGCTNASFTENMIIGRITRAATSAYNFIILQSSYNADSEFRLRGDGNAYADGSWNGGGADYAEYFEWSDGNTTAEDRRGISVVLDGDKIREAVAGEDPIGVISGNPSVVGDAAWNKWSGKYLRDEFGTYIQEDCEVTDDDGNTVIQQRRKLNPAYDPEAEYIPREERPEWDCVGLMGKLRIRKGQITGSRWIKMRDINDSVEEWLVR
jgi:hypothetical protein